MLILCWKNKCIRPLGQNHFFMFCVLTSPSDEKELNVFKAHSDESDCKDR